MESHDSSTYKYYVVKVLDVPREDFNRFFCIPASWIPVRESHQRGLAYFPVDVEASVSKKWVMHGKVPESRTVLAVDILYGADSYEDAIKYTTMLENRFLQEQSYAEIIEEHASSKLYEIDSPTSSLISNLELTTSHERTAEQMLRTDLNSDIPKKATEVVEIGNVTNKNMETSPQSLKEELTLTDTKLESNKLANNYSASISNDSNNIMDKAFVENKDQTKNSALSAADIIKLIFESDFLEEFKRKHSILEAMIKMDKTRHDCIDMSSIMKKIIRLVENYKKCHIDRPNTIATGDIRDTDVENTEKDERIVQNEAKTNTAQRDQESCDVVLENTDNYKKTQNVQQTPRRMKHFTLPVEYDEKDSRWTRRYREKVPGLFELIPYSGVYVNKVGLHNCKINSHDSRTFARLLLVEIFSDNALSVCSLTGRMAYPFKKEEYMQRPGLDEKALVVLFTYVEQYAKERNWPEVDNKCITSSIRTKIREIRIKAYKVPEQ